MAKTKVEVELGRGEDISIINLIDCLIEHAQGSQASDIHIDPFENSVKVRLRIDGILYDVYNFPKEIYSEIISRIKVLAGLRTDEHQSAQDGRFRNTLPEVGSVDIRVSIVPTYHGENAVLRLLTDKREQFTLESLGFSEPNREKILKALRKPHGMILATGPTGSGKTTTLYTLIKLLNTRDVSVITIEDPIEYAVEGIEQIQVNHKSGLTFANGLRSVLRQDPNVIMVGEIRDSETASLAVNTSLTGHLLLSTLHTNDAATILPRLLDMKIDSYLVASTVNIAIAQRLVRKICSGCKVEREVTDAERKSLSEVIQDEMMEDHQRFFFGSGCENCNFTGYQGRISVNEVLVVNPQVRDAILRKTSAAEIKNIGVESGMTTMLIDGFEKATRGVTTISEIIRVIHE
ncbi:MAG: GspE/PulE family protein [Candidatus Taylorbacteria bacterium]